MEYRSWAKILDTVDLTPNLNVYQTFTPIGSRDVILKAIRSCFHYFNDPTFTEIKFRIHGANYRNKPGKLITESIATGMLKTKFTENYGEMDTWWEFNDLTLKAGVKYCLVPVDATYIGNNSSHLAWRKDYPDPVYRTNNAANGVSAIRQSYAVQFITAKL